MYSLIPPCRWPVWHAKSNEWFTEDDWDLSWGRFSMMFTKRLVASSFGLYVCSRKLTTHDSVRLVFFYDIPDNLIVTLFFTYGNVVVPTKKTRRIDDAFDIDHNRQFDDILMTRTNSQQTIWDPRKECRHSSGLLSRASDTTPQRNQCPSSSNAFVLCVEALEICRRPCSLFPDRGWTPFTSDYCTTLMCHDVKRSDELQKRTYVRRWTLRSRRWRVDPFFETILRDLKTKVVPK